MGLTKVSPKPPATASASSGAAINAPTEKTDPSGHLNEIDFGEVSGKELARSSAINSDDYRHREADPAKKESWKRHFTKKKIAIMTSTLVLLLVAVMGVKVVLASQRMVAKSNGGAPALKGDIDPTKLKGEGDGRINILLLGVGGDNHDGGNLSDTMMVASIDPINKNVAMISIPRDLYVKIPGYGNSKINAANSYGGPDLAKQVVSNILDLPIHYYVKADFSGFKQAVDAVGGVDIKNPSNLYDSAYPCDNGRGYCIFNLPAGQYHLNGTTALKFARCSHGSCGNDFGRAARQQELLTALRQKALEASTLTNPVKIAGLIDSVGSHVRTDLQIKEAQKLAGLIKDIDTSKMATTVLDDSPSGLLVDGSGQFPGAGSILLPKAGAFDYTDVQELAHSIFVDAYLKRENAAVEIQNGTQRDGLGAAVAKQLKAYNYNVVNVRTADTQDHSVSQIIDYSGGQKPYTIRYLQSRFGASVKTAPKPAATSPNQQLPDVVIIVGNNYKTTVQ
jgi:LCP family protein required for cell wall assembly